MADGTCKTLNTFCIINVVVAFKISQRGNYIKKNHIFNPVKSFYEENVKHFYFVFIQNCRTLKSLNIGTDPKNTLFSILSKK